MRAVRILHGVAVIWIHCLVVFVIAFSVASDLTDQGESWIDPDNIPDDWD